jgi:6-pyruvoyltetrahydropterin/6-carboxytetrahydropterin synthase
MLSKHPGSCRIPHGHTRVIELTVASDQLDANDMVVDFKVISMIASDFINRFDHSMSLNSNDPLKADIERIHPGGTIVFQDQDPTTEVLAKTIFDFIADKFQHGFEGKCGRGNTYTVLPNKVTLEKVRVSETPSSWAEYGI